MKYILFICVKNKKLKSGTKSFFHKKNVLSNNWIIQFLLPSFDGVCASTVNKHNIIILSSHINLKWNINCYLS